jgi:hypothetical protein
MMMVCSVYVIRGIRTCVNMHAKSVYVIRHRRLLLGSRATNQHRLLVKERSENNMRMYECRYMYACMDGLYVCIGYMYVCVCECMCVSMHAGMYV